MLLTFVQTTIIIAVGLILSMLITTSSQAHVKINIDGGYFDPTPIAIPEFNGKTYLEKDMGKKMSNIINQDLTTSGLFHTMNDFDMDKKDLNNINKRPDFAYFKKKI